MRVIVQAQKDIPFYLIEDGKGPVQLHKGQDALWGGRHEHRPERFPRWARVIDIEEGTVPERKALALRLRLLHPTEALPEVLAKHAPTEEQVHEAERRLASARKAAVRKGLDTEALAEILTRNNEQIATAVASAVAQALRGATVGPAKIGAGGEN